jgi:hypothetical protein
MGTPTSLDIKNAALEAVEGYNITDHLKTVLALQRVCDTLADMYDHVARKSQEAKEAAMQGAQCDCGGRDPWEIACYLSPDELNAVVQALDATTFGTCQLYDIDTVYLNKATKELKETRFRRTDGFAGA